MKKKDLLEREQRIKNFERHFIAWIAFLAAITLIYLALLFIVSSGYIFILKGYQSKRG
jgi:Tfp pilus assembly protein PilO